MNRATRPADLLLNNGMDAPDNRKKTSDRIFEAASFVFAEYGFEKATVREICRLAKANVAAINYHFGDKFALYKAVVKTWEEESQRQFPLDSNMLPALDLQGQLKRFYETYLKRIHFSGGSPESSRKRMRALLSSVSSGIGPQQNPFDYFFKESRAGVKEILENASIHDSYFIDHCLCQLKAHVMDLVYDDERFKHIESSGDVESLAERMTTFVMLGVSGLDRRPNRIKEVA